MFRDFAKPTSALCVFFGALFISAIVASPTHAADPNSAIAAIEKLGGTAKPMSAGWEVEFHLRGRALTDEGLAHVAALGNVASLNLRDTKITSAGLIHLQDLNSLRWLHLERTAVDDQGIVYLAGLVNLEYLNLYDTKVSDKALDHIAGLKQLRSLYVWKTHVTDAGVEKLATAIPKLNIVRGVDLSKLVVAAAIEEEKFEPKLELKWVAATERADVPKRSLNGINTKILFENKSKQRVKLYWVGYNGQLRQYGELAPDETREQNSYSKNVWLITDLNDQPLGYFMVLEDESRAVIPSLG
jgi:hypothetical protein